MGTLCSLEFLKRLLYYYFLYFVLGLAGMDLTFPMAALIVLCFIFVSRPMLKTDQDQGCLFTHQPSKASRLGKSKRLGEHTARTADPNRPKGHSILYDVCSTIKTETRGHAGGVGELLKTFVFLSNHYAFWGPTSQKWLNFTCCWEVENKSFCFALFPCVAFTFLLLAAFILTHNVFFFILFLLLSCRGGRGIEQLWCAPGLQPRSVHHIYNTFISQIVY